MNIIFKFTSAQLQVGNVLARSRLTMEILSWSPIRACVCRRSVRQKSSTYSIFIDFQSRLAIASL